MKKPDISKPTYTTMNTKAPTCVDDDGHVFQNQNLRHHGQQQLKRQVRRRITKKPYQERLMNATEARKEIATALKNHRATMKPANEHRQRQPLSFQPSFYSSFSPDDRFKATRRPRMYPPHSNKILHYLNDFSFSSSFPHFPTLSFPRPPLPLPPFPPPPPLVSNFYPNTISSPFATPPPKQEAPNFTHPSQTLGFNLNLHYSNNSDPTLLLDNNTLDPTLLHDNNTLDRTHMINNNTLDPTHVLDSNILDPIPLLDNNNNNNILEPTLLLDNNKSSLCSYSSPTLTFPPFVTNQDFPSIGISPSQGEGVSTMMNIVQSNSTTQASGSMHVAMDEEIRALGEQHQMEQDDNKSMVTSTWWFNCLPKMEQNSLEVNIEDETCHGIFHDELEFPLWEN